MGSGFVRRERDGKWIEVGDTVACEKVGFLFRNALSNRYKSSTSSKKRHRNTTASRTDAQLHNTMMSNEEFKSATEAMAKFAGSPEIADQEVVNVFTKVNLSTLDNMIKPNQTFVQQFQQSALNLPSNIGQLKETKDCKLFNQ
jgi:hypothetical protein